MNTPEHTNPRTLIIDDSPASIQVMARALAPEFVAEFALSGAEALARLASGGLPDLILLDLKMPDMDGYEVLHRLKADLRTHEIPVIVITASNDVESETVARLGGDEFGVALEGLNRPLEVATAQARLVGTKILAALNEPYRLDEADYISTASIGGVLFEHHQVATDALLEEANLAMYRAKAAGRNTLCFFDPALEDVTAADPT